MAAGGRGRGGGVLLAVALPLAVLSIDFTGVVVALPDIGRDLGMASSDLGWVVNAFALGFAGPLLVVGKLSDGVGHRRVLLAGLGLFAAGSVVCGTAGTPGVLVAGRAVQGVGTACSMTASLAMVAAAFAGAGRARAIGRWSAVGGTASAVGPLVAGLIASVATWRWFFLANLPLLAGAAVLTLATTSPDAGAGSPSRSVPSPARLGGFDVRGAVLSTTGLVLVVFGLQEAGDTPVTSPLVWATLLAGAAAIAAFVASERRSPDPLVRPGLLVRRPFAGAVVAAVVANVGFGALELILTLYLQAQRGWGALATGGAFLAYSIPFAGVGAAMGRLGTRWSPAGLTLVGLGVVAASFASLVLLAAAPWPAVVGAFVIGGLGQGLVYNASSTAAMGAVADQEDGVASALLGVGRNVGLAVGIAVGSLATHRAMGFVDGVVLASAVLATGVLACSLVLWRTTLGTPAAPVGAVGAGKP